MDFSDIKHITGSDFINSIYKASLIKALKTIYSDYQWDDLKFKYKHKGYWLDLNNRKTFLKHLENQFQIQDRKDWLNITSEQVERNGGKRFISLYGGSLLKALKEIYPDEKWPDEVKIPQRYWESMENQIELIKSVEEKLGIEVWSDWYDISAKQFVEAGGQRAKSLLGHIYQYSLRKMITTIYPEFPWVPARFERVALRKLDYDNSETHKDLFKIISEKLQLTSLDDWYLVPSDQFRRFRGAAAIARRYGGFVAALIAAYPDHKWDMSRFTFIRRNKGESFLIKMVTEILPNVG